MTAREKIPLTREQEALLIHLYARAQPNPVIDNSKAREMASSQYDFDTLKVPQKTAVTLRLPRQSAFYRFMFRLSRKIPAARRAHRILLI